MWTTSGCRPSSQNVTATTSKRNPSAARRLRVQIEARRAHDARAFVRRDRLQGVAVLLAGARAHLDEHAGAAVVGDDVELAFGPPPVARDDAQPGASRYAAAKLLARRARAGARIHTATPPNRPAATRRLRSSCRRPRRPRRRAAAAARPGGVVAALLALDAGGLAFELAQVVEARATDLDPRETISIFSMRDVCSGKMRSTPTPYETLRTVNEARDPPRCWPITTPSKICTRSLSPSLISV